MSDFKVPWRNVAEVQPPGGRDCHSVKVPTAMRFSLLPALFLAFAAPFNSSFPQDSSSQVSGQFTLHGAPEDSIGLAELLTEGAAAVEQFFGHPFPRKFDVFVFPDRAALDRQWQQDWGDSTFSIFVLDGRHAYLGVAQGADYDRCMDPQQAALLAI